MWTLTLPRAGDDGNQAAIAVSLDLHGAAADGDGGVAPGGGEADDVVDGGGGGAGIVAEGRDLAPQPATQQRGGEGGGDDVGVGDEGV